ncbi:capsule biosynthesis protein [Planktotalea sp.]|uniref:capsule biosynthesis protein n=1 Tax=Planktotalea sp. TaxID=2029877 RepID=UPI003F6CBCC1
MALAENISVLIPGKKQSTPFKPTVRPARLRRRHVAIAISFAILVCLPVMISAWYLWARAADQYASTFAFSIRSEEPSSGLELLGGIAGISGSGASDSDILYDYLKSQQLVEQMQDALNLSALWSKPLNDPVFAYDSSGSIEDLHMHWGQMVDISLDSTRGIIEVRARAFSPLEAQDIGAQILRKSEDLINQINNIAAEDSVRYALDDLQRTKARLANARGALTEFRILNEIVDPSFDFGAQSSLMASLEAQLSETQIEIDILSANTRRSDTRLNQAQTHKNVLQLRIDEERTKRVLGAADSGNQNRAQIFGEYERLVVDVEFAEQSYQAARASFETAVSDARRNTRYLAAHIFPTIAEQSLFPKRGLILSLIALAAFLFWALLSLIGFSFLDRR